MNDLFRQFGSVSILSLAPCQKLQEGLAQEIGSHARPGTPQDTVRFAEVLLLAVPWAGVEDALSAAGSLEGKILISCVNPLGPRGLVA